MLEAKANKKASAMFLKPASTTRSNKGSARLFHMQKYREGNKSPKKSYTERGIKQGSAETRGVSIYR